MPKPETEEWILEIELAMTSCTHNAAAMNRAAETLSTLEPNELSADETREYFRALAGLYRRLAEGQLQTLKAMKTAAAAHIENKLELDRVKKALAEL